MNCIEPKEAILEKKMRKKAIKVLLKEVLYNSLAQALIKILFTPHLILKLFLSLFVLVSTGFASFLVLQSVMTYLSYGVSTTSRTVFTTPTLFPKVTFCNLNGFTTQYAFNLTQSGTFFATDLTDNEKKSVGHNLDDILFDCKFNLKPCGANDFTWSYDGTYGNCYTFNEFNGETNESKSNLKESSIAGPDYGLQITFYVNIYEKLLDLYGFTWGLGGLIRIGNSSYSTFYLDGGIFIPPGQSTYISIEQTMQTILPRPYSNCEIESNHHESSLSLSDLFNLISESSFSFSQQFCFSQCLQKYFIEKFNCTFPYLPSLFNQTNVCNLPLEHLVLYLDRVFTRNFINQMCLPMCPLECYQNVFKCSLSSYQLIGGQYVAKILNNSNLTQDFIKRVIDAETSEKSIVQAFIFYETLSYTLLTETIQMDAVSLLASIGGNLSLFLGVSVFSICEIIQVAIELCFIQYKT